jgi:Fe-S-cluster containining protein
MSKKEKINLDSKICLSCAECCKRYRITLLPIETKIIARALKKTTEEFIEEDCELLLKCYAKSTLGKLSIAAEKLPSEVSEFAKKINEFESTGFLVLPILALKKEKAENACNYLGKENKCEIYENRPFVCRIFPRIALEDFEGTYDFCGIAGRNVTLKDKQDSKEYYIKLQKYFDKVQKSGFGFFEVLPKKTIIFVNEKECMEIDTRKILNIFD